MLQATYGREMLLMTYGQSRKTCVCFNGVASPPSVVNTERSLARVMPTLMVCIAFRAPATHSVWLGTATTVAGAGTRCACVCKPATAALPAIALATNVRG